MQALVIRLLVRLVAQEYRCTGGGSNGISVAPLELEELLQFPGKDRIGTFVCQAAEQAAEPVSSSGSCWGPSCGEKGEHRAADVSALYGIAKGTKAACTRCLYKRAIHTGGGRTDETQGS